MKKVVLVAAFALVGLTVQAQEGFKAGINLGLPIGDAGDVASFSVGLDVMYHWKVSEDFDLGVATGYTNAFTDEIEGFEGIDFDFPDVQFLPIAASARFHASEAFRIGADLGYALGVNDGNDGGFYYRPLVGYGISEQVELNVSYTGVSLDGGSWDTINLGVLFAF